MIIIIIIIKGKKRQRKEKNCLKEETSDTWRKRYLQVPWKIRNKQRWKKK